MRLAVHVKPPSLEYSSTWTARNAPTYGPSPLSPAESASPAAYCCCVAVQVEPPSLE